MKIIHISDLHLDSPLTSRLSGLQAKERKKELLATFRAIADTAVQEGVAAVIIAGDLFDNDSVGIRTLNYVMSIIERSHNVVFYYLSGNHEKSRLIESGISIPENLKLFGDDWTYFQLNGIKIAGRSLISENMFDTLSLSENEANIVVLHGALAEHTDSTDKIGKAEIVRHPIDYLALGHYHSYSNEKIGERTVAVYSGTPEGRGFDESGEKGYSLLSVTSEGITHEFIPCAQRKIHILELLADERDDDLELEDKISKAALGISKNDILRIIIKGAHRPGEKRDTERLQKKLSSLCYFVEIKDETRLLISSDDYKNDKSLKGEFIRLVLAKEELTDEEKNAIIECGITALAGEEL